MNLSLNGFAFSVGEQQTSDAQAVTSLSTAAGEPSILMPSLVMPSLVMPSLFMPSLVMPSLVML